MQSVTPERLLLPVWPLPLSLATTRGISVDFFSSPYLDVSVRGVPHVRLCIHLTLRYAWVSPFGNPRIEAYLQLPEAYRSLSRPSSAPDAKAFALCSFSLELPTYIVCSCVGPGKSNLPFELRRKAGDCSRVTAGPIDLI